MSITVILNSGVIIGAFIFLKNDFDLHNLEAALECQESLSGHVFEEVFVFREYRGVP